MMFFLLHTDWSWMFIAPLKLTWHYGMSKQRILRKYSSCITLRFPHPRASTERMCQFGISANLIALDSRWPHKFQWWPTPVIGASESSTSTYHVLWQMSASYWLRDKVLISKTWRLLHCSKWRSSLSTPSADARVLTLTMPCGTHRAGRPCA